MLENEHKELIQNLYRQWLADNDYRPRKSQREMVAFIARLIGAVSFDDEGMRIEQGCKHIGVVEAGTGTGKTLAYLLPTIVLAKALDKKLIVSTATISLQEQLVYKDIPELAAVFDEADQSFSVALAKGRGRYLCLSKLQQHLENNANDSPLFPDEEVVSKAQLATLSELRNDYEKYLDGDQSAWSGDSDTYDGEVDESVFRLVAADGATCSGRRCENFSKCALFKSRETMNTADVIIANHDLVLANTVLDGGLLPDVQESIYVFDEAHHLPEKCRARYTQAVSIQAELNHLKRSAQLLKRLQTFSALPISEIKTLEKQLNVVDEVVQANLQSLAGIIEGKLPVEGAPVYRFSMGVLEESFQAVVVELRNCFAARFACLAKLDNLIGDYRALVDSAHQAQFDVALMQLSLLKDVTEKSQQLFTDYATAANTVQLSQDNPAIPSARWLERSEYGSLLLYSAPISCAAQLYEALWGRCSAAIMTSATLATDKGFIEFLDDIGCDASANTSYIVGAIDYQRGLFHVPKMRSDPGNAWAHTEEVIKLLPGLLPDSTGSLVLFSSRKQMDDVQQALANKLQGRLLVQGRFSKNELIRRHKELVDEGVGGVIFGLASLSEGLDLKGDYCTQVVIAKLPFSPPDSPIEEALGEWLEAKGKNPFASVTLPKAMIRLRQACGRLLRAEEDSGCISLLDNRITSRHYGKAMLASLPPFARQFD